MLPSILLSCFQLIRIVQYLQVEGKAAQADFTTLLTCSHLHHVLQSAFVLAGCAVCDAGF